MTTIIIIANNIRYLPVIVILLFNNIIFYNKKHLPDLLACLCSFR